MPIDIERTLRKIVRKAAKNLCFRKTHKIMSPRLCLDAYSDEIVSATELNRQSGRILDKAAEHPVTITRNDQYFALLLREDMANLIKGVKQSKNVVEILSTAFSLLRGDNISNENPYAWLKVFDLDDIQDLISELTKAFSLIESTSVNAWDLIGSIIYEWHESAIAISSPELANAFNDETDELLLTKPFLDNVV
jgi:hypothetical protein